MLYKKECKKISRSVIYYIYCVIMVLFICSQFIGEELSDDGITEPQPGWEDYGIYYSDDPELIMPAATNSLIQGYLNNQFDTYPVGFIHVVHLKSDEKDKLGFLIEKLTGMSDSELKTAVNYVGEYEGNINYDLPELNVNDDLSYDEFIVLMKEADSILGGGSSFAPENLSMNFGRCPKTYEQAKADYDDIAQKDRFSNGYARLFCDYSGLFLSLLPVFVAAAICTSDRRSRMDQLIYAREISSLRIVSARFAAIVTMLMLPVLLTAFWSYIKIALIYTVTDIDNLAFLKYTVIWLLPTAIAATGIGMLITEVFSGIMAVFVQLVWWFVSIMTTALGGKITVFGFVIRHNTVGDRELFMKQMPQFIANRLFFTAAGLAAVMLTAFVYELKRGGKFNGIRVFRQMLHSKSES